MKIDPRLHHYAQNITKGSLPDVLEMYKIFDCEVVYQPNNGYQWAMVGQKQLHFAIQVVEVDEKPIPDLDTKRKTHIAFLSDDPRGVIKKVENWAISKNIKFREGGWSEKECYFDLPDLFVNFVVEIMHTSIEEE
ncbi:MAG TPA: hypothetical protein VJC13_01880 [Candidatus Paceibacterota bacterium]